MTIEINDKGHLLCDNNKEMNAIAEFVREVKKQEILSGINIKWPVPSPVADQDAVTKLIRSWELQSRKAFLRADKVENRDERTYFNRRAIFYSNVIAELMDSLGIIR
jgi:hypothetical protein